MGKLTKKFSLELMAVGTTAILLVGGLSLFSALAVSCSCYIFAKALG